MKKYLTIIAILFTALASAFAVKLPDGKNVRAKNVETYASGALKSVSFRNDNGYDDSEGVEISTPLGSMLVTGEICFYEDGSVKSVSGFKAPQENERFTVNTNFGKLFISGGHDKDFRITFYPSGALWYVLGTGTQIIYQEGQAFPFEQNGQATNVKLEFGGWNNSRSLFNGYYGIHFWDSGKADYALLREARLHSDIDFSFVTKAGEFKIPDGWENGRITCYKDGSIWKGAKIKDLKNGVLKTSLGEIFPDSDYISLWQDGSVRECCVGEVMMETIVEKKVQIPEHGLLAFRKDGSVCGYTTGLEAEYKIGEKIYTANKEFQLPKPAGYYDESDCVKFNTILLDEKNQVREVLWQKSNGQTCDILTFYPSGAIHRANYKLSTDNNIHDNVYSEDGKFWATIHDGYKAKNIIQAESVLVCSDGTPRDKEHYEKYSDYVKDEKGNFIKDKNGDMIETGEYKSYQGGLSYGARNVYFAQNGLPQSYDCYKTVANLPLTWTRIEVNHDGEVSYKYISDCAIDDFGFSYEYLLETDDDGNFVIDESQREIKMEIGDSIRN